MSHNCSAQRKQVSPDIGSYRFSHAFTLIEMLVSMVVLALIVVAMMALVDSATKLWRDNEGRTDACREARAALVVMARDLRNAVAATNQTSSNSISSLAPQAPTMEATCFSWLLFLLRRRNQFQERRVRGRLFSRLRPNPASTNRTLNLYRYFRNSNQTFSNLASATLFANIATDAAGEELLARNVVGMRITPVSANGGEWTDFAPSSNAPLPVVIEITLTAIGQETAKKLEDSAGWTDTNSRLMKQCRADPHDTHQRGISTMRQREKQGRFADHDAASHCHSQHDRGRVHAKHVDRRLTAKSAKNILQAELAARAGLNSAIAQILTAIGTNERLRNGQHNYAVDHGPLVVIGRTNLVDSMQLMPLVSAPPALLGNFLQAGWTNSLATCFPISLEPTARTSTGGRGSSKAPTIIGFIARHGSSFPVRQANGSGGSPSLFSTRMQG